MYLGYPFNKLFTLVVNTCGQQKLSQVLQVLEIFEIQICHIFEIFQLPKVTSTLIKKPTEHDEEVVDGERYSSSGQ